MGGSTWPTRSPCGEGNSPLRCVIAEDQSGPRGYALYAAKPDWGRDGMPAQVLFVRELFWTDPAAAAPCGPTCSPGTW